MRIFIKNAFSVLLVIYPLITAGQNLKIVENGSSNYKIVTARGNKMGKNDSKAANLLQSYINKISGVNIPIVTDNAPATDKEILIGATSRSVNPLKPVGEEDGYNIKTSGNRLMISGKGDMGTTAGVVFLLEQYLHVKKYSATEEDVPQTKSISIPAINTSFTSYNTYREVYYNSMYDNAYRNWYSLDYAASPDPDNIWGLWGPYSVILSQQQYFASHPEWFAERNGKRINNGQLCLSNQDMFNTFVDNLKNLIDKKPNAKYWSIAMNDNDLYCQCPICSKLDQAEKTPTGSYLNFVNKVAARFPNKTFVMLAYHYTTSPPATLVPLSNVVVELCPINIYREASIAVLPSAQGYRTVVGLWKKKTNNLMVWDYITNFVNLLAPFPNFQTLQKDIKFYNSFGIKMFLEQGNNQKGGEFEYFRSYLAAKLLWNPNLNYDSLQNEFLNGYYGSAGPIIKQYITTMTNSLVSSGAKLGLGDNPSVHANDYLSSGMLDKYNALFDNAENTVQNNPTLLRRVKVARLPVRFAYIEQLRQSPQSGNAPLAATARRAKATSAASAVTSKSIPQATDQSVIDAFIKDCKAAGVEKFSEGRTTPDEYKNMFLQSTKGAIK
jgi:Domain of unknown function (DUF4838)